MVARSARRRRRPGRGVKASPLRRAAFPRVGQWWCRSWVPICMSPRAAPGEADEERDVRRRRGGPSVAPELAVTRPKRNVGLGVPHRRPRGALDPNVTPSAAAINMTRPAATNAAIAPGQWASSLPRAGRQGRRARSNGGFDESGWTARSGHRPSNSHTPSADRAVAGRLCNVFKQNDISYLKCNLWQHVPSQGILWSQWERRLNVSDDTNAKSKLLLPFSARMQKEKS